MDTKGFQSDNRVDDPIRDTSSAADARENEPVENQRRQCKKCRLPEVSHAKDANKLLPIWTIFRLYQYH